MKLVHVDRFPRGTICFVTRFLYAASQATVEMHGPLEI